MRAFILAGGFATRLWPLTEKRAKPLLPLAGKPLLTHLVEKIPEGIEITVSTNAVFAEDFEKWKIACHAERSRSIARGSSLDSARDDTIEILIEDAGHEDEKLGALGAVAKWITEEKIEDDVLLLAGDNYIGFSIKDFLQKYDGKPLIAAHDIGDLEQAKQFGIVVTEGEKVTAFEEKPENPQSTLVSTGCSVLPANTLQNLVSFAREHPDNIGGIFEHLLQKGIEVHCVPFKEPWFDIGSFEAYIEATQALVGDSVHREQDITEKENTYEGSVVLGSGSTVLRSMLRNTVLFENCSIENCVLTDCILDNGCKLKGVDLTGKMLREGTRLEK